MVTEACRWDAWLHISMEIQRKTFSWAIEPHGPPLGTRFLHYGPDPYRLHTLPTTLPLTGDHISKYPSPREMPFRPPHRAWETRFSLLPAST